MSIQKQTEKIIEEEIKNLEKVSQSLSDKIRSTRDSAFSRFPLIFLFLSTFGLVATYYGFEKVIDQVPFFNDNPHMVLITGLAILFGTGAFYKKLS